MLVEALCATAHVLAQKGKLSVAGCYRGIVIRRYVDGRNRSATTLEGVEDAALDIPQNDASILETCDCLARGRNRHSAHARRNPRHDQHLALRIVPSKLPEPHGTRTRPDSKPLASQGKCN